jgi:hypothetical protein
MDDLVYLKSSFYPYFKMSQRTLTYNPITRELIIDDGDQLIIYQKVHPYPKPYLTADGGVFHEQSASAPPPEVRKVVRKVVVVPPAPAAQIPMPVPRVIYSSNIIINEFPSSFDDRDGCYVVSGHTDRKNQVAHHNKYCQSVSYWISKSDWIKRVLKTKGRGVNAMDFCQRCCFKR